MTAFPKLKNFLSVVVMSQYQLEYFLQVYNIFTHGKKYRNIKKYFIIKAIFKSDKSLHVKQTRKTTKNKTFPWIAFN